MRIFNLAVVLLLGMPIGAMAQDRTTVEINHPSFEIETTAYYELPADIDSLAIKKVSDDGNHPAIQLYHRNLEAVYFRGTTSKYYSKILAITLSSNAERTALVAWHSNKYIVIVDGLEIGKDYLDIKDAVSFSPGGKHYLYNAQKKSQSVEVVVDGHKEAYDGFMSPIPDYFSPDGDHSVYIAREGKKSFVVHDGVRGKKYQHTGAGPYFSPDGASLAYAGYQNDTAYLVINGQEYGGYTAILQFAFSPDSRHYAYTAYKNYDAYIVLDDKIIGPYQQTWDPSFSGTWNHFGYIAKNNDSIFFVIDSIERPKFTDVGILTFSPDETHFAYVAYLSLDSLNKQVAIVYDDKLQKMYHDIDVTSLVFSENGDRFGYIALADSETTMAIIDGVEGKGYHDVIYLKFSPDNQEYAYRAEIDESHMAIVRNGLEGRTFRSVGEPVFSPDGKFAAYSAYQDGKYYMVINDEILPGFDDMSPITPEFDDNNRLTYFVKNGKSEVLKVTVYPSPTMD